MIQAAIADNYGVEKKVITALFKKKNIQIRDNMLSGFAKIVDDVLAVEPEMTLKSFSVMCHEMAKEREKERLSKIID